MPPSTALSVLVVDDDPLEREVLVVRLRGWGHEASAVGDVATAVRRVRNQGLDVVISDLVLPERSGLDLIRALKNHEGTPPVILITAHDAFDEPSRRLAEDAVAFLTKPLDAEALKIVLDRVAESEDRPPRR